MSWLTPVLGCLLLAWIVMFIVYDLGVWWQKQKGPKFRVDQEDA